MTVSSFDTIRINKGYQCHQFALFRREKMFDISIKRLYAVVAGALRETGGDIPPKIRICWVKPPDVANNKLIPCYCYRSARHNVSRRRILPRGKRLVAHQGGDAFYPSSETSSISRCCRPHRHWKALLTRCGVRRAKRRNFSLL